MKLVTIVGARPQFIKAASLSRAIADHNKEAEEDRINEVIVHTGQHYDYNMSRVFFDELGIPVPRYHLDVGSGSHGRMTGLILERVEKVLSDERPDCVLVYGDTNTTLAGALAAAKMHIPVAHVEAGLRSFNRDMPEEINRVVTDHLSNILLCPTDTAVKNLEREGITDGVFKVGDVMFDSFLLCRRIAEKQSRMLSRLGLKPKSYCLATVHREENTNNQEKLAALFDVFNGLARTDCPFIVPLHPRTAKALEAIGLKHFSNTAVRLIEPVSYLDMIILETNARLILTDSGGVQKEAYFAAVPCVTLRDETEWVELLECGANVLGGHEAGRICEAFEAMVGAEIHLKEDLYGDGEASKRIVETLIRSTSLTKYKRG